MHFLRACFAAGVRFLFFLHLRRAAARSNEVVPGGPVEGVDGTAHAGSLNSSAPMSGAEPRQRAWPSSAVGVWPGIATPALMVGDPSTWRKLPPAALA